VHATVVLRAHGNGMRVASCEMVDVGVGSSLTKKQRLEVQRQRAKGCGSEDVLVNE
jgi:hypothetical protein